MTPVASCSVDRDCGDPDKCVEGTCRDACNVDPCGANAICKSRLHASSCSCPIGYTGNPQVQCLKSKYFAPCVMLHLTRMFQSPPTLFRCWPRSARITPSVLHGTPVSTGSASIPVLSQTLAPQTHSARSRAMSLSAHVQMVISETLGCHAQSVSFFFSFVLGSFHHHICILCFMI